MTTYDIMYDTEDDNSPFKVGNKWVNDLSEGDIEAPLTVSIYNTAIKITLPITCRTNDDFYNLYPEYLI
jgi:hypothetical protein